MPGIGKRSFRIALLAVLVCAGIAAWKLRSRTESPRIRLGYSTATLIPGVHMLGGLGPSAAYVVETLDGLVLIDSGLEADAFPLKAELERLGLDWKRIVAIFLTHAHGDHTGGAEYLQASTGARVYAGRGDVGVLQEGQSRDAFYSTFPMPNHSPHPTRIDVPLEGGETLSFGNTKVEALALPGHTPGSVCYLVERGGKRILFTGDVIMQVGGPKAVGTYSAHLAPRYRGDAETYLTSLQALRQLPVPDLVLPGHPFTDVAPQYPELSQTQWEALVDDGIQELTTLIARFRDDGRGFLDGEPKRIASKLYYLGDRNGNAVYLIQSANHNLLVNAPGGSGLADFVSERMRGLKLEPQIPDVILLTSINEETRAALAEFPESRVVFDSAFSEGTLRPENPGLSATDLATTMGVQVKAIELRGREQAAVAYEIKVGDRPVLFTPRIPALFDSQSVSELTAEIGQDPNRIVEYLWSIRSLSKIKPDLWLPSRPSEGQNANLYDDVWNEVIVNNYAIGYKLMSQK